MQIIHFLAHHYLWVVFIDTGRQSGSIGCPGQVRQQQVGCCGRNFLELDDCGTQHAKEGCNEANLAEEVFTKHSVTLCRWHDLMELKIKV